MRMLTDTFERLFEEHSRGFTHSLAYHTDNRTLAEDVLWETFEQVLRSRAFGHMYGHSPGEYL
jgi:DNA-directed RNA polymerase specialized sigma24 family protein